MKNEENEIISWYHLEIKFNNNHEQALKLAIKRVLLPRNIKLKFLDKIKFYNDKFEEYKYLLED